MYVGWFVSALVFTLAIYLTVRGAAGSLSDVFNGNAAMVVAITAIVSTAFALLFQNPPITRFHGRQLLAGTVFTLLCFWALAAVVAPIPRGHWILLYVIVSIAVATLFDVFAMMYAVCILHRRCSPTLFR
jgi:hypothetical protein